MEWRGSCSPTGERRPIGFRAAQGTWQALQSGRRSVAVTEALEPVKCRTGDRRLLSAQVRHAVAFLKAKRDREPTRQICEAGREFPQFQARRLQALDPEEQFWRPWSRLQFSGSRKRIWRRKRAYPERA